jgi:hypothetical protein
MDLQFILDAYACVMYIVSYISKAQRGMSNLLYNATKEAKEDNLNLRNQVKAIGNKFLTHVEVSAQEAVYCRLGINHDGFNFTMFAIDHFSTKLNPS